MRPNPLWGVAQMSCPYSCQVPSSRSTALKTCGACGSVEAITAISLLQAQLLASLAATVPLGWFELPNEVVVPLWGLHGQHVLYAPLLRAQTTYGSTLTHPRLEPRLEPRSRRLFVCAKGMLLGNTLKPRLSRCGIGIPKVQTPKGPEPPILLTVSATLCIRAIIIPISKDWNFNC